MSDISDIRKYVAIMEGELIPQRQHTLRVNLDDYSMMRAILHMPSPANFTTPNHYGKVGIISFWDSLSYLDIKNKLDQFGVPYDEEPAGTTTFWDNELTPETEHSKSPYPSNSSIQQHFDGEPPRPARNLRKRKEVVKAPPPLPPRLPRIRQRDAQVFRTPKGSPT